jgi:hypothetical protein
MLNLGHLEERIATRADRVVLSTTVTRAGERVRGEVTLGPNEGVILVASTATHS